MIDPAWVTEAYNVVASAGAMLAVIVMQLTEHDRINRDDQRWLQWIRRAAFIGVALALIYSVWSTIYEAWCPSLQVLMLVTAGTGNLFINAMALILRGPALDEALDRSDRQRGHNISKIAKH